MLIVANASMTDLTGNLNVNQSVLIDNTLNVYGRAILDSVRTQTLNLQSDNEDL